MIVLRLLWLLAIVLLATRRSNPMPTDNTIFEDTTHDNGTGDVVNSDENPVLAVEPDEVAGIDVLVNMRLARTPNGHHAIAIYCPENVTLTAAQAHQLHVDLEAAGRVVADIRRDAGYGS